MDDCKSAKTIWPLCFSFSLFLAELQQLEGIRLSQTLEDMFGN